MTNDRYSYRKSREALDAIIADDQKVLDAFFEKLDQTHVLKKWLYLEPFEKPTQKALDQYFESPRYYYYDIDNKRKNPRHEIRLKKEDFLDLFGFFVKTKSLSPDHQQFNQWVSQFIDLFRGDSEWIYEVIKKDRNLDQRDQDGKFENQRQSIHYKWFPYLYTHHEHPIIKHKYHSLCDAIQKKDLYKISEITYHLHIHLDREWDHKRSYRNSRGLLDDIIMYFKIYEAELFKQLSHLFNQASREQLAQMDPDIRDQLTIKLKPRTYRSIQIFPENFDTNIDEDKTQKFNQSQSNQSQSNQSQSNQSQSNQSQSNQSQSNQSQSNQSRSSISSLIRNTYQTLNDALSELEIEMEDDTQTYKNNEQILKYIEDKIKLLSDQINHLQEKNSNLEEENIHHKRKYHKLKSEQDLELQKALNDGKEKQLIEMLSSMRNDYPDLAKEINIQKWFKSFHIHPMPSEKELNSLIKINKQDFLESYEDAGKQGFQNVPAELLNYGWKLLKQAGEEKILVKALIDWIEE